MKSLQGPLGLVAVVPGFAAAAVASFFVIRWAYETWGLLGGAVALFVAPETVGFAAYYLVAMAIGAPLALLLGRREVVDE